MTAPAADDPFAPFAVLGLDASASLDDLRAARRTLARELHPDLHPEHGGDASRMQAVNAAFDLCVGHVTGRRPLADAPAPTTRAEETVRRRGPFERPVRQPIRHRRFRGVEHDTPSFTIDALPAEAFEALLVVASWIGEVLDDEPPYVLECHLFDPGACWCRLDLVPDAGGSTVSLTVAPADDATVRVTAEQVRDVWVELLNRLGQPQP